LPADALCLGAAELDFRRAADAARKTEAADAADGVRRLTHHVAEPHHRRRHGGGVGRGLVAAADRHRLRERAPGRDDAAGDLCQPDHPGAADRRVGDRRLGARRLGRRGLGAHVALRTTALYRRAVEGLAKLANISSVEGVELNMEPMDMEWPSFSGVPEEDALPLKRSQGQALARWIWWNGELREAD